jgi:hypothetical protein
MEEKITMKKLLATLAACAVAVSAMVFVVSAEEVPSSDELIIAYAYDDPATEDDIALEGDEPIEEPIEEDEGLDEEMPDDGGLEDAGEDFPPEDDYGIPDDGYDLSEGTEPAPDVTEDTAVDTQPDAPAFTDEFSKPESGEILVNDSITVVDETDTSAIAVVDANAVKVPAANPNTGVALAIVPAALAAAAAVISRKRK